MQKKSRNDILTELYASGYVQAYLRTISHPSDLAYLDDAEGLIWLIVAEIPEDRLQAMYEEKGDLSGVRRFVTGIIRHQLISTKSVYYRTFKRPYCNTDLTDCPMEIKEVLGLFDPIWLQDQRED